MLLLLLAASGVAGRPSEDTIRYQIQEELPAGTRVGNVVSDAGLRRRFAKNVVPLLEYRFLSEPAIPLVIGLSDGVIRTSGVIDRDSIPRCRQRDSCDVLLDVTVQPVAHFLIIKISIEVMDVNDNSPRFDTVPSGHTVLSILESAAVGSTFLLPSATDPDSPSFGVHRYDIASDSNKFGLSVTKKLDGFLDVRLRLRERLDREMRHEYRLRLIAFDGGHPARSDTINITVRVLDANDNDPVFERQTYEVTMIETDAATGSSVFGRSPITRVRATDPDRGDNGRIVYGFAPQTRALYGHLFAIDNRTGEIYARADIDRERHSAFQLIVTAEDAGPDSHPVDATVVVTVADVNDNRPTIVVNTLAAVGADRAAVPENAAPGTFVAHVTVVDPDAGRNGTVNCTLLGAGAAKFFTLEERSLLHQPETEYQVLTVTALDREVTSTYELSIACTDLGNPPQHTVRRLPVTVSDENDNPPIFSRAVYSALITENNQPGAQVVRVNATDPDKGENGTIAKYVIVGDADSRMFSVDERGKITVSTSLDREVSDVRRFQVLAVDSGSPPRTGSALVVVSIDDVDDCEPAFVQQRYSMTVMENLAPGASVGSVLARDADLPPHNAVRYSFAVNNQATDCFYIDEMNGTLTTRCRLDREIQPIYYMTVTATSPSPPAAESQCGNQVPGGGKTASVDVYVGDENDYSPTFLFPSPDNDTVAISSATPEGHSVAQLVARDRDADANGRLSYRLEADKTDESSTFVVDPVVGTVHVSHSLIDIDHQVFRLTVVAEDGGRPNPLSTKSTLTIVVNKTILFTPTTLPGGVASSPLGFTSNSSVVILGGFGGAAFLLVFCLLAASLACARRRRPFSRRQQRNLVDKCRGDGSGSAGASSAVGVDDCANDVDSARATEGVKMLTKDSSSAESTPIKQSASLAFSCSAAVSTSDGAFYNNQGLDSSNGRSVANNSVVLLSSLSSKDVAGRSLTQCDVIDSHEPTTPSLDAYNKRTSRSVDVVGPSAIVSGGTMTMPAHQQTVNGSGGAISPWQRGTMSRALPSRPGGGSCSYGASSPCCKLLPSATVTTSSHTPAACHLRSVTLPRGHPATYSGEIAARLKPPPPPSAAAIRQATQRASLLAGPMSKTLDTRARSHGRAGANSKTSADSNVEQRKSVSTVIV